MVDVFVYKSLEEHVLGLISRDVMYRELMVLKEGEAESTFNQSIEKALIRRSLLKELSSGSHPIGVDLWECCLRKFISSIFESTCENWEKVGRTKSSKFYRCVFSYVLAERIREKKKALCQFPSVCLMPDGKSFGSRYLYLSLIESSSNKVREEFLQKTEMGALIFEREVDAGTNGFDTNKLLSKRGRKPTSKLDERKRIIQKHISYKRCWEEPDKVRFLMSELHGAGVPVIKDRNGNPRANTWLELETKLTPSEWEETKTSLNFGRWPK